MLPILQQLADSRPLTKDQALRGFQMLMNGGATPAQMAAFLMALRMRGETVDEITAGAEAMRAKALRFKCPEGAIDTCGTGGDARGTYNISTAVAFVLAGCGLPVVKHGNRSVSSQSGSADVLEAVGMKIDVAPEIMEQTAAELGIAFLFAPRYHKAMRNVAPVRSEMGVRTIFNILGPLSNPAKPDYQLLGVYHADLLDVMAQALKDLGTKAAWVVYGADGLDEMSLSGVTKVTELKDGGLRSFEVTPEDAGLERQPIEAIKGQGPKHNADALLEVLSGVNSAYKDAVMLNAAAALLVAGRAKDLIDGVQQARNTLDEGRAHAMLQKLIHASLRE